MVDNQIRPNKVNDEKIIDLFRTIEKELFLPEGKKRHAYVDCEIEIDNNRYYQSNMHIAQLLQAANISKLDNILHIGSLTGYVTLILSKLANNVVAIENDYDLYDIFTDNVKKFNMDNVLPINSDYKMGYEKGKPYNIIFIDSLVESIPNNLYNQLDNTNGRIITIEKINSTLNRGMVIIKNDNNLYKDYIFDSFIQSKVDFEVKKSFQF